MKATVRWQAYTLNPDTDEPVPVPADLDGWAYQEDQFGNYLDTPVAEAGVIGGEVRAAVQDGKVELLVDYWCPDSTSAEVLEQLRQYSIGQMSDGMGECGFVIDSADGPVMLVADEDQGITLETSKDDRVVPGPPRIAIAARDGDLPVLKQLIDGGGLLDQYLQGSTGLHDAISNQHLAAVRLLLEAGADPNLPDFMGRSPLHLCADKRTLSDADACEVAEQLLLRGADPALPTGPSMMGPGGDLAVTLAEQQGKTRLAELLKRP